MAAQVNKDDVRHVEAVPRGGCAKRNSAIWRACSFASLQRSGERAVAGESFATEGIAQCSEAVCQLMDAALEDGTFWQPLFAGFGYSVTFLQFAGLCGGFCLPAGQMAALCSQVSSSWALVLGSQSFSRLTRCSSISVLELQLSDSGTLLTEQLSSCLGLAVVIHSQPAALGCSPAFSFVVRNSQLAGTSGAAEAFFWLWHNSDSPCGSFPFLHCWFGLFLSAVTAAEVAFQQSVAAFIFSSFHLLRLWCHRLLCFLGKSGKLLPKTASIDNLLSAMLGQWQKMKTG